MASNKQIVIFVIKTPGIHNIEPLDNIPHKMPTIQMSLQSKKDK